MIEPRLSIHMRGRLNALVNRSKPRRHVFVPADNLATLFTDQSRVSTSSMHCASTCTSPILFSRASLGWSLCYSCSDLYIFISLSLVKRVPVASCVAINWLERLAYFRQQGKLFRSLHCTVPSLVNNYISSTKPDAPIDYIDNQLRDRDGVCFRSLDHDVYSNISIVSSTWKLCDGTSL